MISPGSRRWGRRGAVAVGVLALWLAGLALLARRELFRTDADRLAVAALRVAPGASYYAVVQGDKQIGFASSTIDTTTAGVSVSDYLVADVGVGGKLHRATATTRVTLTRALRVTGFDFALESEQIPVRASGIVSGDTALTLILRMGKDDPPDTQYVALKGPVLLPTLVPLAVALGDRPKVGKRYTLPVFDPTTMAPKDVVLSVTAESLFVVSDSAAMDPATKRWVSAHADTVRAWRLVPEGGSGFSGWVDERGSVVEASQPGNLALRRTAYELAFENWRTAARRAGATVAAGDDVLETTAISANAPIDQKRLSALTVRLANVSLTGFDLEGGRQRLRGDTLEVRREPPEALRAGYTLPNGMRARFTAELSPEPLIQSRAGPIAILAARIAGRDRDPRVVAEKINRWVHDSLTKRYSISVPSALEVLRTRAGDCNEHTQLYIALARAIGIPARSAAGLALVGGKFYYHAWPEVYLGTWVAVDPTFGQFPADAAHLRFINGGLTRQAELLRLIGNLNIDVVKTRR